MLDFLLKILNNPMDFKLKWADYWPSWEFILIFFLCGLFWLCVVPWVICFMFGVV